MQSAISDQRLNQRSTSAYGLQRQSSSGIDRYENMAGEVYLYMSNNPLLDNLFQTALPARRRLIYLPTPDSEFQSPVFHTPQLESDSRTTQQSVARDLNISFDRVSAPFPSGLGDLLATSLQAANTDEMSTTEASMLSRLLSKAKELYNGEPGQPFQDYKLRVLEAWLEDTARAKGAPDCDTLIQRMQNLCLSNGIAWQYVTDARRILRSDITGAYANKKPLLKPLPEVPGYKFNPESDQSISLGSSSFL